ncbi:MAG: L,D-transpeptidase family protein [Gammaproteobacteria bacterium]
MNMRLIKTIFSILLIFITRTTFALTFDLPTQENGVVGQVQKTTIEKGQDPHEIARQFDVGYDALLAANPRVNFAKVRKSTELLIPTQFILPSVRDGIVINLAEKSLYYFPANESKVYVFPIGIGQLGWSTPIGTTSVFQKVRNPIWTVPNSVYKKLADQGIYVAKQILPGPDDPLGSYALRLALRGYLIHGTNDLNSVGSRSSSGCIRLLPNDIEELFKNVPTNTAVHVINEPYKAAWSGGQLYLEAHHPLDDSKAVDNLQNNNSNLQTKDIKFNEAGGVDGSGQYMSIKAVITTANAGQNKPINWNLLKKVTKQPMGIPMVVSLDKE